MTVTTTANGNVSAATASAAASAAATAEATGPQSITMAKALNTAMADAMRAGRRTPARPAQPHARDAS